MEKYECPNCASYRLEVELRSMTAAIRFDGKGSSDLMLPANPGKWTPLSVMRCADCGYTDPVYMFGSTPAIELTLTKSMIETILWALKYVQEDNNNTDDSIAESREIHDRLKFALDTEEDRRRGVIPDPAPREGAEPYSVLLRYPDYYAGFPDETYLTTVLSTSPDEAEAVAREECMTNNTEDGECGIQCQYDLSLIQILQIHPVPTTREGNHHGS